MAANNPPDDGQLLTTTELAARWGMNEGTLRIWRSSKRGPAFILMSKAGVGKGGIKKRPRVRYRLADIVEYERKNRRQA